MSRASGNAAVGAVLAAAAAAFLWLPSPAAALASEAWAWPVEGAVITPYRNGEDPYARGQHRGIDVAAAIGSPVVAATDGSVRFAGVAGSSGLTLSIRTSDGRFDTSYLHLSRIDVREGDRVSRGLRIGAVGATGRRSAAEPHLHFGVREAGTRHAYRDPLDFLPPIGPRPVRELPRHGPLPVIDPVRVAPAPERVRARAPVRRPAPVRRRVRFPARRPVPAPVGSRVPRALPRLDPARVPRAVPAPGGASQRHAPRPAPAPAIGPRALPAPEPQPHTAGARPPLTTTPGGGLDLGWALACAGLLLAAACLGRPGSSAPGSRHSARVAWSRLRPLLGGR